MKTVYIAGLKNIKEEKITTSFSPQFFNFPTGLFNNNNKFKIKFKITIIFIFFRNSDGKVTKEEFVQTCLGNNASESYTNNTKP